VGDRIDKTNDGSHPFERATQDLSEREEAKSRQADLTELASSEPDAEGEALPAREPDSRQAGRDRRSPATRPDEHAADDDGADDDRGSSTAKPITAHSSE
jgi:hypothetical protein